MCCVFVRMGWDVGGGQGEWDALHAPGTAPVVAVVEVEPCALEDEGADAVLLRTERGVG